jgi:hypothetical protein
MKLNDLAVALKFWIKVIFFQVVDAHSWTNNGLLLLNA